MASTYARFFVSPLIVCGGGQTVFFEFIFDVNTRRKAVESIILLLLLLDDI